jgi:hypothetical protein
LVAHDTHRVRVDEVQQRHQRDYQQREHEEQYGTQRPSERQSSLPPTTKCRSRRALPRRTLSQRLCVRRLRAHYTVLFGSLSNYTRVRLGIPTFQPSGHSGHSDLPTAICGRTEETSVTDSREWKIQMLVSIKERGLIEREGARSNGRWIVKRTCGTDVFGACFRALRRPRRLCRPNGSLRQRYSCWRPLSRCPLAPRFPLCPRRPCWRPLQRHLRHLRRLRHLRYLRRPRRSLPRRSHRLLRLYRPTRPPRRSPLLKDSIALCWNTFIGEK